MKRQSECVITCRLLSAYGVRWIYPGQIIFPDSFQNMLLFDKKTDAKASVLVLNLCNERYYVTTYFHP